MPPRKRAISRTDAISAEDAIIKPSTEVATHARPSKRKWKLPSSIRFALAVLVSMSLNVLLYGLATDHIRDLTVISRLDADWTTALVLFGGRIAELAVAWVAGFDGKSKRSTRYLSNTIQATMLRHLLF